MIAVFSMAGSPSLTTLFSRPEIGDIADSTLSIVGKYRLQTHADPDFSGIDLIQAVQQAGIGSVQPDETEDYRGFFG
jgi:hypothetical protein